MQRLCVAYELIVDNLRSFLTSNEPKNQIGKFEWRTVYTVIMLISKALLYFSFWTYFKIFKDETGNDNMVG